jgi:hypothetical protein
MNKLGINYTDFDGLSLEECFKIISESGFDCILRDTGAKAQTYPSAESLQINILLNMSVFTRLLRTLTVFGKRELRDKELCRKYKNV